MNYFTETFADEHRWIESHPSWAAWSRSEWFDVPLVTFDHWLVLFDTGVEKTENIEANRRLAHYWFTLVVRLKWSPDKLLQEISSSNEARKSYLNAIADNKRRAEERRKEKDKAFKKTMAQLREAFRQLFENGPARDVLPYKVFEALPILGLSKENLTQDAVVKAFRKLAHSLHPDKGGTDEGFAELSNAKDVILDYVKTLRN